MPYYINIDDKEINNIDISDTKTIRLPEYRIKQDIKSHNDRPTKDF